MPAIKPQEPYRGKRRKVLLVGVAPSLRDSICTLLTTMEWTCAAVSAPEDVLHTLERQAFGAVLLDLTHSGADAEHTILAIREIRPSLSERIVVMSSAPVDPETLELIERYNLLYLSQKNILSRLWSTLEELVTSPASCRGIPRNVQVAKLLFDSFRASSPAGVRSSGTAGRHYTFEHSHTTIDVLVDVLSGSDQISLVGQVLDSHKTKGGGANLVVVLRGATGTLARTTTSRLGEFNLEFPFAEDVNLEIQVGQRSWISVPLREMDWVKERMPRATGT